ncbi:MULTISPECIES: UDP-2,4-diacetamido-2,4,6-trideoxy-beta-L-altropyranose hydrolase [unclassified Providencia]|uniref:UDP-2,4-diacetamido-2,4, 6-trideoxy-beta-L-altropyranose hydrolase n=1 Tax=unclassified Providencia TaxID=2633465 RepID=UPI0023494BDF|nr:MULTISPECIES: UDP-2,4-diacetamido-2,4,6-trideoxy-beta-L-altropyranose hydrolase [unclassified Providencia]
MRVIFRVDASKWIGSGHVMRCLVLAESLQQKNIEIYFACLPQQGDLIYLIKNRGYRVIELTPSHKFIKPSFDGDYISWLQRSIEEDANDFLSHISDADWVVIDHYALDYKWEKRVKDELSCKILSIDDLNRKHYSDIIVDQNLWPNVKTRYNEFEMKKLIGPDYALLRSSFSEFHKKDIPKKNQIIAFFGGSDLTNECQKLFNAASKFMTLPFELKIITGRISSSYDKINSLNKSNHIKIFQYLDNFDEELASSLYAIGASGTSNWERFCLRIPSTIVSVAENQRELSEFLSKKGLVKFLGIGTQTTERIYYEELQRLSQEWENIKPFSKLIVDGLGSKRVVREMGL